MPRPVTVDFTGAPPAQGGGRADHIPPGRYPFRITRVEDTKSRQGNRMWVVTGRVHEQHPTEANKRLLDHLALESASGSKFGLQRAHAFLVALGSPPGERSVTIDLDNLNNVACYVDVVDEIMEATDQYDARVTSRIVAYHHPSAFAQNGGEKTATPAAAPTPAPTPPPAPTAPAEPIAIGAPAEVDDIASSVDKFFE